MRILALIAAIVLLSGVAWEVTASAQPHPAALPATVTSPALAVADPASDPMGERALGNPKAPVTMVEYFSLTCPHCAKFETGTFQQLKTDYIDTGKLRYIARDFPFDKAGLLAASMARCAPADRYFPLVDLLFKGQEKWGLADDPGAAMTPLGRFAGLSDSEIKSCFDNKDLQNFIVTGLTEAQSKYKVNSTPTFIFNGGAQQFSGDQPYDKFKTTIDGLLAGK